MKRRRSVVQCWLPCELVIFGYCMLYRASAALRGVALGLKILGEIQKYSLRSGIKTLI